VAKTVKRYATLPNSFLGKGGANITNTVVVLFHLAKNRVLIQNPLAEKTSQKNLFDKLQISKSMIPQNYPIVKL
jgi:hypothetical protein